MTATYEPAITLTENAPSISETRGRRIAARREALTALDSFVRPLLADTLRMPLAPARPTVDLTVYGDIYRRSGAGGHWDVTSRWLGLIGHTIASYAVSLRFDAQDRPSHFVISGAREFHTVDATPEALSDGLDRAAAAGPLVSWAPSFVSDISL